MRKRNRTGGEIDNTIIEVKEGLDAIRNLKMGIFHLATRLVKEGPTKKGLLILVGPKVSKERLTEEEAILSKVLEPGLLKRIQLVTYREGQFFNLPDKISPKFLGSLEQLVQKNTERAGTRLYPRHAYFEILKILINQWLLKKGPQTAEWLSKAAGCSYPTVAAACKRLDDNIKRGSYRRIELSRFPKDEWSKLIAMSDRVRSTMYFVDSSGQPRPPENLLNRLRKMNRPDIGVGGVLGARHYWPDLDVIGTPRLDLTVHCPYDRANILLLERLDPALRQTEDKRAPAAVAVHFIRRYDTLFKKDPDGLIWADPVECMMDLHEMKLEAQVLEFLEFFSSQREKT